MNRLIPLFFFAVGTLFYVVPYFGCNLNRIPGDLLDSRLNTYFLEHGYRWLTGKTASFWDAPFFYPVSNVISYSDNLLGSLPFYTVWRLVGLDRETSYQLWFIIGFILNFISIVWVLRSLINDRLAVSMGAFIFSFSTVVLVHQWHSQLHYRFAIPLTWYFFHKYLIEKEPRDLFLAMLFLVWQFYCSIYLGYFLTLFIITYFIGMLYSRRPVIKELILSLPKYKFYYFSTIFIAAVFLLILLHPYMRTAHLFKTTNGLQLEFEQIKDMLPRLISYALSYPRSSVTGWLYDLVSLPYKHEHIMFIGFVPWFSFFYLAFYSLINKRHGDQGVVDSMLLSIIILTTFTISIRGRSIYFLLTSIPGVAAIRAVTRIIMVLLLPFSILVALFFARLGQIGDKRLRIMFSFILCLLILTENRTVPYSFSKSESQQRVSNIIEKLGGLNSADYIIARLNPSHDHSLELDTMIASQDTGSRTINGYSGRAPVGHKWLKSYSDVPLLFYDFKENNVSTATDKHEEFIVLYESPKGLEVTLLNSGKITAQRKPMPVAAFDGTINPSTGTNKAPKNDSLLVNVQVKNNGYYNWPAKGTNSDKYAVRFSYRWVRIAGDTALSGFDERFNLPHDLGPGEEVNIRVLVSTPKEEGQYYIEFDLLQEDVAWFSTYCSSIGRTELDVVSERKNSHGS